MGVRLTCSDGHAWEITPLQLRAARQNLFCPVCGVKVAAPALADTFPDSFAEAPAADTPRTGLVGGGTSRTVWERPPTHHMVTDPTVPPPPGSVSLPPDAMRQTHHTYALGPPLAQGGLGQILLARDEQLGRTVALKEMLSGPAQHPDHRERFYQEAALTSLVEHPGVVPVYDMGVSPEGKPFYTMKLIKGRTFADALDDYFDRPARAQFRELLYRFVAVCNTMAFAHSRGVIHRDLKPTNIMLGEFGETLIVDWGLAKLVTVKPTAQTEAQTSVAKTDPPPENTATTVPLAASRNLTGEGDLLGTPAYMPPEQAQGDLEKLGPAADIYALGVILYEILTGQRPHRGTPAEIVQLLLTEAPQRPSRVRAGVPRSLEAVCLKTLAYQPGDRYATALELAADVERWLNDEPVSVLAEPLAARLGRWARRHRGAVMTGVALLVTALIAVVVGAVLLAQEQSRTQAAWQQSVRNEQEAAGYFRLAQKAVDDLCTRIGETQLRNQPGMEAVRKELLAEARKYYQQLVRHQPASPALLLELAKAQRRLANVTAEIESSTVALPLAREALATLERLQQERPEDADVLEELSVVWHNLGKYLGAQGQAQAETDAYGKALRFTAHLARLRPPQPFQQFETASTYYNLGFKLVHQQRWQEAEASYRQAQALLDDALRQKPNHPMLTHRRSVVLNGLGILYKHTGRLDLAQQAYGEAAQAQLALVAAHPQDMAYKEHLATIFTNLAVIAWEEGRIEAAFRGLRQAVDYYEELVREFPRNLGLRDALARATATLGEMHLERGEVSLSRQFLDQALQLSQQRVELEPTVMRHRWQNAEVRQLQVRLRLREGNLPAARTLLVALEQDVAQWDRPDSGEPATSLAIHRTELRLLRAALLGSQGQPAQAVQVLREVASSAATPEQFHRAARLCAALAQQDSRQTEACRPLALGFLRRLRAAMPHSTKALQQELRTDPLWVAWRDHEDLRKLFSP